MGYERELQQPLAGSWPPPPAAAAAPRWGLEDPRGGRAVRAPGEIHGQERRAVGLGEQFTRATFLAEQTAKPEGRGAEIEVAYNQLFLSHLPLVIPFHGIPNIPLPCGDWVPGGDWASESMKLKSANWLPVAVIAVEWQFMQEKVLC